MRWCTGDAVELAAALARQPQTGGVGVVRPPAIVVEYMGQGSLKGALARKADIVQGPLIRVLIAMDAAKVGFLLQYFPSLAQQTELDKLDYLGSAHSSAFVYAC